MARVCTTWPAIQSMALLRSVGAFQSSSRVRPSDAGSTKPSLMAKMVAIGAATALVVAVVMGPPVCLPVSSTFLPRLRLHPSFEDDERLGPETLEVGPQRGQRLRID